MSNSRVRGLFFTPRMSENVLRRNLVKHHLNDVFVDIFTPMNALCATDQRALDRQTLLLQRRKQKPLNRANLNKVRRLPTKVQMDDKTNGHMFIILTYSSRFIGSHSEKNQMKDGESSAEPEQDNPEDPRSFPHSTFNGTGFIFVYNYIKSTHGSDLIQSHQ